MDIGEAGTIYNQLKDTRWTSLKDDLVELAIRYARVRVDWLFADQERRRLLDEDRSVAHNAFIASCDILARNMAKNGEDATWRQLIGTDRKVVGDFACFLHCIFGVSAR